MPDILYNMIMYLLKDLNLLLLQKFTWRIKINAYNESVFCRLKPVTNEHQESESIIDTYQYRNESRTIF